MLRHLYSSIDRDLIRPDQVSTGIPGTNSGGSQKTRGWWLVGLDSMFRQNAAHNPTVDWSHLDASLHAATFLAQRSDSGSFCQLRAATGHTRAIHPFSAPSTSHCTPVTSPVPTRPTRPRPPFTGPPARTPICIQWNKGDCTRADCCYRHSCVTCLGSHWAIECPAINPGSNFKRAATQPGKRFQWTVLIISL